MSTLKIHPQQTNSTALSKKSKRRLLKRHNRPLACTPAYNSWTDMHCSMQISHRPTPARTCAGSLHHASHAAIRISNTAFVRRSKVVASMKSSTAEAAARWASHRQVTAYSTNGATHASDNSMQPSSDADAESAAKRDAEEEALDRRDDYCAWWDEADPAYHWDEAAQIAQCVQLLQSNDVQQQALACKRLRGLVIGSVETGTAITEAGAIPHVIRLLSESTSVRVRRTAAVAIISLAAEGQAAPLAAAGAVPVLIKNLSHPNESLAGNASRALNSITINVTYGGSKARENSYKVFYAFTPEVIQQIREILPDFGTDHQWGANTILCGLAWAGHEGAKQAMLDMGYTKEDILNYRL